VLHDLLGITTGYVPKFVKPFAKLKDEITRAVTAYRDEVRAGTFPDAKHTFD
jgi:3-methyl-2-oxobutanoate hydroxymethyltransferase